MKAEHQQQLLLCNSLEADSLKSTLNTHMGNREVYTSTAASGTYIIINMHVFHIVIQFSTAECISLPVTEEDNVTGTVHNDEGEDAG